MSIWSKFNHTITNFFTWTVVVAQMVQQLLPIHEIRGSNPVIGKIDLFY